jgi:cysteinyl-tRNA synthetase
LTLHLYNTLARAKQSFEPMDPDHVRMYVCGPTVYDLIHIGNARPIVIFDILYRLLKQLYPTVTYVRNITDVDDKINARAAETGVEISELTKETTIRFHQDAEALGALEPDVEPRATDHIPEMLALIERLIEAGNAYATEDGHVLFHVPSMPDYGQLSRRNRDELIAGARVDVASYKKDPADFVLWKPSAPDLPGWESPWGPNKGRGRPGWHAECSAMSQKHLGEDFDIHGGGVDLVFPHHENEIAQSLCANPGSHFAKYWVHNGYLMSEGDKMSKSLGNFYTVRELLEEFPGEALRLILLQTHYRRPLDFTKDGVRLAKATLDRFYGALRDSGETVPTSETPADILDALQDDLNTPLAVRGLHGLLDALNDALRRDAVDGQGRALLAAGAAMGLLQQDPEEWFKGTSSEPGALDDSAIDTLIAARRAARADRDFAEADRIRDELTTAGVILEDKPDETIWRRK